MRVAIKSTDYTERVVNGANGSFTIRSQIGFVQLDGENYARPIQVPVPESGPYPAGTYTVSDASYYVGRYDKLTLGAVRLKPVETGKG